MQPFRLKKQRKPMMPPKPEARLECPGHVRWVAKTLRCCIEGKVCKSTGEPHECFGRIDPHHVKSRGARGGDDTCAPLCRKAHDLGESPNWSWKRFQEEYGVDLLKIAAECWRADVYHRLKHENAQRAPYPTAVDTWRNEK